MHARIEETLIHIKCIAPIQTFNLQELRFHTTKAD